MVISSRPLIDLVPVQPAAMAGRQLCQWDKDSCADAGFLKIDLLGLGMLSAVEDCVEKIAEIYGAPIDLSRIPLDDRDVFAEIQRADTVGTFQIESRAQMQSLLRTKPENIDDLTVQVALVRPGPIQGKAVHPYIEHRKRLREDPSFVYPVDHESLREPLRSTLGVVVFQDQVLDVAIALAGFTVGEAEGLRRAMSRKRSRAALESHRVRFIEGAVENGVDREGRGHGLRQARRLLRLRLPEVPRRRVRAARLPVAVAPPPLPGRVPLLAAERPADGLLPAGEPRPRRPAARGGGAAARRQPERDLVRARRRPPTRLCRLVIRHKVPQAVRIGLAYIQSVGEDDADALVAEREANGAYRDVGDLARRVPLAQEGLVALVEGGACDGLGSGAAPVRGRQDGSRRRSAATCSGSSGSPTAPSPCPGTRGAAKQLTLSLDPTAATPELRDLTRWEQMAADYRRTGLSVGVHPLTLLRPHLPEAALRSDDLHHSAHGSTVAYAGLAIARQRPATAKGIVFMLLEDECGQVNLIVPKNVYEQHRAIVRNEPLLLAHGRYERVGENRNILVTSIETLGALARRVAELDVGAALPRAHHFGHR